MNLSCSIRISCTPPTSLKKLRRSSQFACKSWTINSSVPVQDQEGKEEEEFVLALRLMFDMNAVHWSLYSLVFPVIASFICCSFLLFSFTLFGSTKFESWALSFPCNFFKSWAASFCLFVGDCSWIKSEPGFLFSRAFFLRGFSLSTIDSDSFCNLNNCSSSRRGVT